MEPLPRALALCVALVHVAGVLPCPPSGPAQAGHAHHGEAQGASESAAAAALEAPCPCGCGESQSLHAPQRSGWAEATPELSAAEARAWLPLVLTAVRLPEAPSFAIEPVPI